MRYFFISYIATRKEDGATVNGSCVFVKENNKFFNPEELSTYFEENGLTSFTILNHVEMTEQDYNDYNQTEE